jgi:hypothetical protein
MYVSKADPGIALITFSGMGEYVAFHRCGARPGGSGRDATAEFAMIDAFIGYEVPFAQWHIYPTAEADMEKLRQMELTEVYERALSGLSAVLYRARLSIRPGRPKLQPMFLLATKSDESVLEDQSTEEAIYRALLGEEGAARRLGNLAELRQRLRNQSEKPGES